MRESQLHTTGDPMPPSDTQQASGKQRGRWGQGRRMEFIDSRLCWEGRLNRTDLTEFFGISIPQASLDLAKYAEVAPGNAVYDLSQKAYLATADFKPRFADGSSARYLAELYALTIGVLPRDVSFIGFLPTADVVRHPMRSVPTGHLRQTLIAIREKRQLTIAYQAISRPEPTLRVISPHAMGYDGFRWHIRAYCHLRGDYRDFVFARVLELELGASSDRDPCDDEAWHRMLDVIIAPHPQLAAGPRRIVALDYGMENERLHIPVRQALALYLLKRLGLLSPPSGPVEQHIVLANLEELVPFVPALARR
jgi:hypothetical protein